MEPTLTVGQLIEKLQQCDPTLPIYREDAEWGPMAIDRVATYDRNPKDFPPDKPVRAIILVIE